jgi:ABC-type Co2+ transport system permease subunit
MISHLIAGVIGISMLAVFLGIVVVVLALLLYDFVQTLRFGESGPGR